MPDELLEIIFYHDGKKSASALFPESLEQGLAMLAQIGRGNLMPGIEADAAELRRGNEVIKFVTIEPEGEIPRQVPPYYFELWNEE
jgi:hypothetical protein